MYMTVCRIQATSNQVETDRPSIDPFPQPHPPKPISHTIHPPTHIYRSSNAAPSPTWGPTPVASPSTPSGRTPNGPISRAAAGGMTHRFVCCSWIRCVRRCVCCIYTSLPPQPRTYTDPPPFPSPSLSTTGRRRRRRRQQQRQQQEQQQDGGRHKGAGAVIGGAGAHSQGGGVAGGGVQFGGGSHFLVGVIC